MTPAQELEALRTKLKARAGKGGFSENAREMQARIAELEKQING